MKWVTVRRSLCVVSAGITAGLASTAAAVCTPEWSLLGPGTDNGVAGSGAIRVYDLTATTSGLYAGGTFTTADGIAVNRIAKWDGSSWSALGAGLTDRANDIAEWDGAIYAGGNFTTAGIGGANRIAKWDGVNWSALGAGVSGEVFALAGDNSGLYVGGSFTDAAGVPNTARIAKWDGANWSSVGGGVNGIIHSMTVHNGELYVASNNSSFTMAGPAGISDQIAKWDGANWSAVPTGFGSVGTVAALRLASLNGDLYCYVSFNSPAISRVAKLVGSSWSFIPGDLTPWTSAPGSGGNRGDLAYFDDGSGPALYVAGGFTQAGGTAAARIAKWNGSSWSALDAGLGGLVRTLAVYNGGLYAGGDFIPVSGGLQANRVARWSCAPIPTGACCLPSGVCDVLTQADCVLEAGTYQGDGVAACGTCVPAPTGACCSASGCAPCWRDGISGCLAQGGLYLGDDVLCESVACPSWEAEPNDAKPAADTFTLVPNQQIAGTTTGVASNGQVESADYFLIQTTAAASGIYRHRLVLRSDIPGHFVTLRGLSQTTLPLGTWPCGLGMPEPGSDENIQSASIDGNDRVNTWYGFGKQEQLYLRVEGRGMGPATTAPYVATLETQAVTPTDIGSFQQGTVTIDTIGPTVGPDTGLRIFNQSFEPVPGYSNDGVSIESGGGLSEREASYLHRTYQPGTYYLAVSNFMNNTNIGYPCDDAAFDPLFQTLVNGVTDYANVVVALRPSENYVPPTSIDMSFSITDDQGTHVFSAHIPTQTIAWFKFTVVGAGCPADFNGDHVRDVSDLFGYINAWLAKTPNADFNHDTVINVADLFSYINAWLAGC